MSNSPKFVLVGQPNSGKSTLFNVLSDKKASTSNYPGTTISISESQISVGAEILTIVDLPGIYSLNFSDKSEENLQNFVPLLFTPKMANRHQFLPVSGNLLKIPALV